MENPIQFHHFQEKGGKQQLTTFALSFNGGDMKHTLAVQFGDLSTTLNAHDTVKLIAWLESLKADASQLSLELDKVAWDQDMADQEHIRREWQAYRNEGLGTSG